MLAALLCNNGVRGRKIPRNGIINGRFFSYEGDTYDREDKPERATIKRIAKCLAKIQLPKEVREEVRSISRTILVQDERYLHRDTDLVAYRRLVELLRANVEETEEEALLLLLMEL